jgi:hypothetical protein
MNAKHYVLGAVILVVGLAIGAFYGDHYGLPGALKSDASGTRPACPRGTHDNGSTTIGNTTYVDCVTNAGTPVHFYIPLGRVRVV